MRRRLLFLSPPVAIGLLFWNSFYAAIFVGVSLSYFVFSSGIIGAGWRAFRRRKKAGHPDTIAGPTPDKHEPTLITHILRAPHEFLDVDTEAGTSTIMNSFFEKVKTERHSNMRLSKHGRRITAAKNEMMARRRRTKQAEDELHYLLASRPPYSGKVIQFKNLTDTALKKYEVGKEVEGINGLATEANLSHSGRGSHRIVIHCQNGRLMQEAGEGQVAFLPGTKFVVVSRERWKNPDHPEAPEGLTIELKEVA